MSMFDFLIRDLLNIILIGLTMIILLPILNRIKLILLSNWFIDILRIKMSMKSYADKELLLSTFRPIHYQIIHKGLNGLSILYKDILRLNIDYFSIFVHETNLTFIKSLKWQTISTPNNLIDYYYSKLVSQLNVYDVYFIAGIKDNFKVKKSHIIQYLRANKDSVQIEDLNEARFIFDSIKEEQAKFIFSQIAHQVDQAWNQFLINLQILKVYLRTSEFSVYDSMRLLNDYLFISEVENLKIQVFFAVSSIDLEDLAKKNLYYSDAKLK